MSTDGKLERTANIVGIVGGIIGIVVALSQNRPAWVLAVISMTLLALAGLSAHLWRAKTPSGAYTYGWQRWAVTASAIAVMGVLVVTMILPSTRRYLLNDIAGFPDVPPQSNGPDPASLVEISGIAVAESPDHRSYRIQASVRNKAEHDQQISQIGLRIRSESKRKALCHTAYGFELNDRIKLLGTTDEKQIQGSISAQSGEFKGFELPVSGKTSGDCNHASLEISFKPNVTLARNDTTVLVMDLPGRLKAAADKPLPFEKASPDASKTTLSHEVADDRSLSIVLSREVTLLIEATVEGTIVSKCHQLWPEVKENMSC